MKEIGLGGDHLANLISVAEVVPVGIIGEAGQGIQQSRRGVGRRPPELLQVMGFYPLIGMRHDLIAQHLKVCQPPIFCWLPAKNAFDLVFKVGSILIHTLIIIFFRYIHHRIAHQIKTNVSAPASDAILGSDRSRVPVQGGINIRPISGIVNQNHTRHG